MIKCLFCLLAAINCILFVYGAGGTDGEEVIVLDNSSTISHDVLILQVASGSPLRKELAKNVSDFEITHSGHFILRDLTQGWFKGRVDSSLTVTKQALKTVPHNITRVAISEDGKRIAWENSDLAKSELIVEEYSADKSKVLRVISKNGIISAPSWSPDGSRLAYYYGPPGAEVRDGYILMVLDVNSASNQPDRLAAPSLWTRLSPCRPDPPQWSPDGKFIRFEARYDEDVNKTNYVVSADGKQLAPAEFSAWDREGGRGYGFKRESNGPGEFLITESDILPTEEKGSLKIKYRLTVSGTPIGVVLSPSATKVAYMQNDKEAYIYDSTTGKTSSIGKLASIACRLMWIDPDRK
jgi:hypothetical protein